jgi:uncharacterized membrane protein
MNLIRAAAFGTAFAAAVTGGSLFAFSTFVMPALDRLPGGQAIAAMQAINVQAPRSLLMLPLFGGAIGGLLVAVLAFVQPDGVRRGWLVVGAIAAIMPVLITAIYHVPHNDALARLDPTAPDAASAWVRYSLGWTRWNHARAAAGLASAIALFVGAKA